MTTQDTDPDSATVISAWQTAGEKLGVTVEAPYVFTSGGKTYSCLAFLPHFGTRKGILILGTRPPRFDTDQTIATQAADAGMGCSFINVERYRHYDEQHFRSTLHEWGYYGPADKRPDWLREEP